MKATSLAQYVSLRGTKMKYIIDRFEGSVAVCENEQNQIIKIDKQKLPKRAKEGDVLQFIEGVLIIDAAETNKRKEKIKHLMKNLWKD